MVKAHPASYQMGTGASSPPGVKQLGHDADTRPI
jgi:hypothetical protein